MSSVQRHAVFAPGVLCSSGGRVARARAKKGLHKYIIINPFNEFLLTPVYCVFFYHFKHIYSYAK